MKKKIYIESIILILLGSFSSLSLPPFNYILINFFTFSLFYILLIKIFEVSKNKKLFFLYGWSFGLGYFISNLYQTDHNIILEHDATLSDIEGLKKFLKNPPKYPTYLGGWIINPLIKNINNSRGLNEIIN